MDFGQGRDGRGRLDTAFSLRYSCFRPERRIGQRGDATRAPTQGPRPETGRSPRPFPFSGIGTKAINPGVRGRSPRNKPVDSLGKPQFHTPPPTGVTYVNIVGA
jgi:hypothetical protein